MFEKLLTAREVAEILKVTETTLANWRFNKRGPPYYKLQSGQGGTVRYSAASLGAWLAQKKEEEK